MKTLFTPVQIGNLRIPNRIAMSALYLAYCVDGYVNERLIDFYIERAQGGVGLLIVGGCAVDEYSYGPTMLSISDEKYVPGLKQLVDRIKEYNTIVACQLFESGRYASAKVIGKQSIAPSPIASRFTREVPRELTRQEIKDVVEKFAQAAERAKRIGFDSIEVIGATGYLISQFLSSVSNQREDEYGGSLENRMRFGLEIAERIRETVGPDYPIIYRVSGKQLMPGGYDYKETIIFCKELEKRGIDAISVTGGWHESKVPQTTMDVPRGGYVYLAAKLKESLKVPVIACNRIIDPELADKIIFDGLADIVGMARPLIADPDLPRKAKEGRMSEIRKCIGCNQGCLDHILMNQPVQCLVNARAGREKDYPQVPADRQKKVLVIGGGVAGLEAARVAALRGHQVVLHEATGQLGGQLDMAATTPGRSEFKELGDFLCSEVTRLGVKVKYNVEAKPETVKAEDWDVLIVATGARNKNLDGVVSSGARMVSAWDILRQNAFVGRKVVVIGGGAVGCKTALYIAKKGAIGPEEMYFLAMNEAEDWENLRQLAARGITRVTVVEQECSIARDVGRTTRWILLQELQRAGVQIITGARVKEVKDHAVVIAVQGSLQELPADTVVAAVGALPNGDRWRVLVGQGDNVHIIGDAKEPRNMLEAIQEAFETAYNI